MLNTSQILTHFVKHKEEVMKKIFVVMFILLAMACNGQQHQFHTFGNPVPDADYYFVFVWEGNILADCPLQQGIEILTPEIMALKVDSVTVIDHYYPINLNGQTIRTAVVAFNSLDQSTMGVTAFHIVPVDLAEPVIQGEIQ